MDAFIRVGLVVAVAAAGFVVHVERATACGCFSPPQPPPGVTADQYAVAQQAEQIIFEVEPGFITAHVLIRYEGAPESFAWIVPVPSEPELALSENITFALLDDLTRPQVSIARQNLCPGPSWQCTQHPSPVCGSLTPRGGGADAASAAVVDAGGFGGSDAGPSEQQPPPVEVISREIIGSYDTIVFAAADAGLAVTWLQDEGFIVNDTMTPFMQPYLDAGMLFVASRLVPGAGVEEIRPLRMRFASDNPMIPLQLTAVAAEPHLTVTAFIYGDTSFEPDGLPITTVDPARISVDPEGRNNYPMALAAAVDAAGGNAFVVEYDGVPPISNLGTDPFCCGSGFDSCGLALDGQCQCPGSEFDEVDCAEIEGLVEGVQLMNELSRYRHLTRLTTRVSPEEMDFDPSFIAMAEPTFAGRLRLTGSRTNLAGCVVDVIDRPLYESIEALQACASVYCGAEGVCGTTPGGPGCACGPNSVARSFTDLDGELSVTCVPDTPPVDLAAGGIALPDACAGVNCGAGACVELGGFPACRCNPGAAAVVVDGESAPSCRPLIDSTDTPGATDFSGALSEVRVCAPAPPESCGPFGWLEPLYPATRGEMCASSVPDPALLVIPDAPTCADVGLPERGVAGGGCSATPIPLSGPLGSGLLAVALALVFIRRRPSATS